MDTIKGMVILATNKGEVAEIITEVGIYGINKVVRSFIDFRDPLKKGDELLLAIDRTNQDTLIWIQKVRPYRLVAQDIRFSTW